jgi:6-phosphogluconolactonase
VELLHLAAAHHPRIPRLTDGLLLAGRSDDETAGLHYAKKVNGAWDVQLVFAVPDLAAICWHPTLAVVYGVSGAGSGVLHTWDLSHLASGGAVVELDRRTTDGTIPCDVVCDQTGAVLVAVNFGDSRGGGLTTWNLSAEGRPEDESATTSKTVSADSTVTHPHQVVFARNRMYVSDLGLDALHVHPATGAPTERMTRTGSIPTPKGAGPRHMVIRGDQVVLAGELASELGILDLRSGAYSGARSTERDGPAASRSARNYPGDIKVSRDGRYAYIANRGYDTVSCFDVSGSTPLLMSEHAMPSWPQHMLTVEEGLIVASWDGSAVSLIELDGGVPARVSTLFECPGAAWLLPVLDRKGQP